MPQLCALKCVKIDKCVNVVFNSVSVLICQCTLSCMMSIYIHVQISFLGEEGDDGGGPRREFFRLLADDVKYSMCIGRSNAYVFRHDTTGIRV